MTFLLVPIGFVLPTISGWLLVRLLEGKHAVLLRPERWVLGFLCGTTLTMFCTFLFHSATSIPLTRLGFLFPQLLLTGILTLLWHQKKKWWPQDSHETMRTWCSPILQYSNLQSLPRWLQLLIALLTLWTILKIAAGLLFAAGTPAFLDDTLDNWNLRGKVFFVEQQLTLELPFQGEGRGISSYPPTLPLVKTWLAALLGQWHEGVSNVIHPLWYLTALILLFTTILRYLPYGWALLGTYVLASLPLYWMHGINAYADVFLSAHIFASVSLFFAALSARERETRLSFLRLSLFTLFLLPLTKNEGLVMYFPLLFLLFSLTTVMLFRQKKIESQDLVHLVREAALYFLLLLFPWLLYKWTHGLSFGNAKAISELQLSWKAGVLRALAVTTFFEGNWLLLPSLLIILILWRWRAVLSTPLLFLVGFIIATVSIQTFLFLFTNLAHEALLQTGSARGLIHVAPIACLLATLLLHDMWKKYIQTYQ